MTDPLELAANAVVTVSILLAGRNSVHTWWTGIVGCALFMVVFAQAQLYADVVLQAFFIATSAVGWWQWLHGGPGRVFPVTHASTRLLGWAIPGGVVVAVMYGALLHRFTDAYAPFIDSAILVFSVIAQLLLMQRRVESWGFWLLVNTLAAPLYLSRGLEVTAALYAAYWINAAVSWPRWQRMAREPVAVPA